MTTIQIVVTVATVLVLPTIGWLLSTVYRNLMDGIRSKVDKCSHDQCTKAKEDMNKLLLDELRLLRSSFDVMNSTLEERSNKVVEAVLSTKSRRKK